MLFKIVKPQAFSFALDGDKCDRTFRLCSFLRRHVETLKNVPHDVYVFSSDGGRTDPRPVRIAGGGTGTIGPR